MKCNNRLSIQQLLYSTYNCISLTAFNSYSMISYAYQAYSPIIKSMKKKKNLITSDDQSQSVFMSCQRAL